MKSKEVNHVRESGRDTPLENLCTPCEVALNVTFLASKEALYITGRLVHQSEGKINV